MTSPVTCNVTYVGLIQRIIGRREKVLTLGSEITLGELLHELCARHGPELEHHPNNQSNIL